MMSNKFFVISLILFGLIVNGIIFVVDSEPITISDSLVTSDFLITKDSDYKNFGFFNVVDPVVYESEVLCEGNLPLVISFDKAVSSKSFFSSSENMKNNINDIRYVYQILVNESYVYKTPVYKTVKEIVKGNASNGTRDTVVESQVVDYYKDNTGFRWVWKDIKSFESISISKDKFVILNVKGFFKPDIGSRKVDIVPCFTIGNEKQELTKYAWWNSTWNYRKAITLNSSQVPATLTNFPVLINITDTGLRDYAQDDGDDIAFTNSLDIQLNHEIELFNGTSGQLVAWVNVTSLSHTADTTIYMYYNNSAASNQENVAGTWNSNYTGVWHFSEGTGTVIKDSTSNAHNGTLTAGGGWSTKIGNAYDFDGSTGHVDFGFSLALSDYDSISVFATVKSDVENAVQPIAGQTLFGGGSTGAGYYLYVTSTTLRWRLQFNTIRKDADNTFAQATDYNILGTINRDYDTSYLYYSCVEKDTVDITGMTSIASVNNFIIGAGHNDYFFNGIIDEVRLYEGTISEDYYVTYNNNINNATNYGFFTVGSIETGNALPVISNENPLNESVNNPLSLTWNCTITENDGESFNWSIECSNGQSISINGASNGSKSLPLTGLSYITKYYVFVNVTDGIGWTNETFNFWTMSKCPEYTNYSTNYSIWFCVNVSDDLDDIDFLNVSLFNNSQYKTWYAMHNGTFCVLFNNLTVGVDYIVNISVFDGFCWTNSSETISINEGGITDLNILLSGLSIENTQLFLFILLTLWIYFLKEYLDKRNSPNGSMLAKIQLALAFPLTIQIAIISFSFVFGYILVFIIPVLAIYIFLDSTIYMKNNKK